jgi:hypothetical protein
MDVFKNLLGDEKGLVFVGLIIAATVLTALGKMTVDQWTSFATWAFGIYAGASAIHGGLSSFGTGGKGNTAAAAPPKAPTGPEVVK